LRAFTVELGTRRRSIDRLGSAPGGALCDHGRPKCTSIPLAFRSPITSGTDGMTKIPDEIDLCIIDALRKDGRTPNKSIAKVLNVSETTVASRIRSLTERNVMQVALQRDIYSLGYQFQGFLDVYVTCRNVDLVAADIVPISGVLAVAIYLGRPDILVSFAARDRDDLARIVTDEIGKVAGIQRVDSYVALEIRKFEAAHVALGENRVAN
jgi:Lrp/AsnC family transcriptional regulator, regulator for asnA, asnC and gidA